MSQTKAVVDKLLTNVSQKYVPSDQDFIGEKMFPELKVKQRTGKIGKAGLAHLRIETDLMQGKGAARRVEVRQTSSDSYDVESHGLEDVIAPEEYDNYEEPFNLEEEVTIALTMALKMGKEKGLADTLANASITTQGQTLSGTSQFNDYTNSDPIGLGIVARTAIRNSTGAWANAIVADAMVIETLRYHPKILRNLGYADNRAGQLTNEDLAKALNVKKILAGNVMYNSAKEGQADALSSVWGKNMYYMVLPDTAQKNQITAGYTVRPSSEAPYQVFKQSIVNPPNAKSIIVKNSYDDLLTNALAVYRFTNAIA